MKQRTLMVNGVLLQLEMLRKMPEAEAVVVVVVVVGVNHLQT
jgi:hypothetical protein